ncbi:hypothetical protein EHS25_004815 [Saitozyma podzolica]|uniref:Uncharacterized protein n=1 Tax=Saitozyma podzolica TaxID=1890683 RepID=A0A427Y2W9_9TREE|nr:hypothetical protein EHS25_004815 [Saitozyma podzolica]
MTTRHAPDRRSWSSTPRPSIPTRSSADVPAEVMPWRIDNKYYTADVHFRLQELLDGTPVLAEDIGVVIYLFGTAPRNPLPAELTRNREISLWRSAFFPSSLKQTWDARATKLPNQDTDPSRLANKYLDSVADHKVRHRPTSNFPFHPIVFSLGGMMNGSTTKVFASWKRVMTRGTYNLMLKRLSLCLLQARVRSFEL